MDFSDDIVNAVKGMDRDEVSAMLRARALLRAQGSSFCKLFDEYGPSEEDVPSRIRLMGIVGRMDDSSAEAISAFKLARRELKKIYPNDSAIFLKVLLPPYADFKVEVDIDPEQHAKAAARQYPFGRTPNTSSVHRAEADAIRQKEESSWPFSSKSKAFRQAGTEVTKGWLPDLDFLRRIFNRAAACVALAVFINSISCSAPKRPESLKDATRVEYKISR